MSIGQRATPEVRCDHPGCNATFVPPEVGPGVENARRLAGEVGWTVVPKLKPNGQPTHRGRIDACPEHAAEIAAVAASDPALRDYAERLERELAGLRAVMGR